MKLAWLALLVMAFPVRADDLLEKILQRLAEPAVIRAQFVQERHLADLARPAVSRGRLTVSRRDGVLWQVESPVKLALAFTPQGIVETNADGERRVRGQRRGAPEAEIGRLMRDILAADQATLTATFDARASGSLERWTVHLAPRARETARFLREIRLGGGERLETIEIEETSGNLTAIRMRQFTLAEALTDDERALFKAP